MQADSQKHDTFVTSKRAILKRIKGLLRLHEIFQGLLMWPCCFLLLFLLDISTNTAISLNANDLWIPLVCSGIITVISMISTARNSTRSSLQKKTGQRWRRFSLKNKTFDGKESLLSARITTFIIDCSHKMQEQQERLMGAKQSHEKWALWFMSESFNITLPGVFLCVLTTWLAMCPFALVFLPFIFPVVLSAWVIFGIVILLRKKFTRLLHRWHSLSLQILKWGEDLEKQVHQDEKTIQDGKELEG